MPVSVPRRFVRALTVALLVPTVALGSLLVTSPADAQRIKPGFFGMHDSDWTTRPSVPVGSANFTTSGTYWPSIETSKGVYNWTRLTQQVAAARAMRAQPMIVLGHTPRFYSARPGSAEYTDYMPNIRAWKRYVTKVARKFKTRLAYQIWPEPNIIQNWKGSPRQMAKLTTVAAKAIKRAAGKRATVISPAVALRLPSQRTWMVKYFKQSVGGKRVHRYVDAIALDPFPERRGTPEDSFQLMHTARKLLARIGVRKPLWNNEINYGVAGGGATTPVRYSVSKQQSYVVRTYVLSAAAGMQRTYWLGWFSTGTMGVGMASPSGATLPPGKSYAVVRSWLIGTSFKGCSKKKNAVVVCTTRKGRKEVRRIYWTLRGKATIKTPRSTLRAENQNGAVSNSPPRRIRVDYRPIMVASRR